VIENCAIATMDGPRHDQAGTEYRSGHVTVTGDLITAGLAWLALSGCTTSTDHHYIFPRGLRGGDADPLAAEVAAAAREVRAARRRLADLR
jgi:hypothetical protein